MQGISQMYKQIVKQEKTSPKIFHRECGCILDKIASRAISIRDASGSSDHMIYFPSHRTLVNDL